MLSYEMFQSIHNDRLRDAWLFLQEGTDMTAFQQYDWYITQETSFRSNRARKLLGHIKYFLFLDDGVPVLIAPMCIQKRTIQIGPYGYQKGIYFLGMRGYSDYLNFVYREMDDQLLAFALGKIAEEVGQTGFVLTQIPEKAESLRVLKELSPISTQIVGSENCVKLEVPESPEQFFSKFSKNLISNLKKQRNKYRNNDFEIETELYEGVITDPALCVQIRDVHEERYANKNKGNRRIKLSQIINSIKKPLDETTHAMENNKANWLLVGRNKGQIIAYLYGLKDANAIRIMQLGFLEEYAKFMPGIITFLKFLTTNYERFAGTTIDFTRGEERYKYEIGGETHAIVDIHIQIGK